MYVRTAHSTWSTLRRRCLRRSVQATRGVALAAIAYRPPTIGLPHALLDRCPKLHLSAIPFFHPSGVSRAALKLMRVRVLCQNAGPLQSCNQLTGSRQLQGALVSQKCGPGAVAALALLNATLSVSVNAPKACLGRKSIWLSQGRTGSSNRS